MQWTSKKITQMQILIDSGHSYSEAGEKMGISRNAVAGKVNRLRGYERHPGAKPQASSAKSMG
jgi:hypothetical protein